MAEINDVNSWGLFLDFIKLLANWIGAFITAIFMLIIGVTRNDFKKWMQEHNEMLAYIRDKTGGSAMELQSIKDQETIKYHKDVAYLKHEFTAIQQQIKPILARMADEDDVLEEVNNNLQEVKEMLKKLKSDE